MKTLIFWVVAALVSGCSGSEASDSGQAGIDGGGGAGADAGTNAGADAGSAADVGSSGLSEELRCLPSSTGNMCTDAARPHQYLCNAIQSAQPDPGCMRPAAGPFVNIAWCCATPMCVRQSGTEYLCMADPSRAKSYLCADGAPIPAACTTRNNTQLCCP